MMGIELVNRYEKKVVKRESDINHKRLLQQLLLNVFLNPEMRNYILFTF